MHQYLQRLRSYQGPLATPSFGLTSSSRRHNKRSKGSHVTVSANHAQGQVRKLQNQHKTPKQGLPTEGRKPGLPATSVPPRNAKPDVSASDRTLNVIVRDRGGNLPADPVSAQQRLKAILTEDRQDTPAPGSQIREGFQVVASITYPHDEPPVTLPKAVETVLAQHFGTVTAAKKAIRRKEILVAGKVCDTSRVVQPGERVEWIQRVQGGSPVDMSQAPAKLQVVYEDEHMACVVKPPGMPTTQSGISGRVDLRQCLPYCLQPSQEPGMLCRPQHVHRLDEATGGLLLVAKTRLGLQGLSSSFEQRQVQKSYRTVVGGRLEGRGFVDIPLDGKPSLTEYRCISQTQSGNHGWISTLDLCPHTGRMHQLRRHMALLGHPVLGDSKYTYGYAMRHPDAAIQLKAADAEEAMSPPFGVSSEHPSVQKGCDDKSKGVTGPYSFWVSQRMAIGNGLVAVSQKGLAGPVEEASSVERLSIREAGIRSLIRQRITWDSQAAAARPRAYHTDSHIVRLEQERAAGEKLSTSEDQETKPAGQQQSRLHTELHMPSTPDLEPELTSSVAADMTGCSAEDCTASDGGRDNSEVQDARCGGCHMDGMPKLLKRPEVLQTPIEDQVATSIGRAGNRDGFKVVVSSRLRAAAPNYAGAVQPQQQQLAGSMSHAQLAMPFSHLLCLWAIKLVLPHPVTQKVLKLGIPDPPVFDQVRTAEARLGRQACSMQD